MSFWHKTPSVNLMIYALRQLKCKVVFAGICDFEFVPPSPLRPESNPTIRLSPHVSESYVVAPLPWDQMPTVLYIYIYIYILNIIMINKKYFFIRNFQRKQKISLQLFRGLKTCIPVKYCFVAMCANASFATFLSFL
jgi:hypothetical protein